MRNTNTTNANTTNEWNGFSVTKSFVGPMENTPSRLKEIEPSEVAALGDVTVERGDENIYYTTPDGAEYFCKDPQLHLTLDQTREDEKTMNELTTPQCPNCHTKTLPHGTNCPPCERCGKAFNLDNDVFHVSIRSGVRVAGFHHCPTCFQVQTYDELQATNKTSEVMK